MTAFERPSAGEWVQPQPRGYKQACCDCGLVHRLDFRIRGGRVQFRVERDNRSTAMMRRWRRARRAIAVAALGLLLAGCAGTIPAAARPVRMQPYLAAWLAAGYPRGDCDKLDVRVLPYTDQAVLNRDCGTPAWGCTHIDRPLLIRAISNNPAHEYSWVVAHELVHALHWCGQGKRDPNHLIRELWGYYDEPSQRWVEGMEHRVHAVLVLP